MRGGWGTGLSCAPHLPKPGHSVLSHPAPSTSLGSLGSLGKVRTIRTSGLGQGIICLDVIATPSLGFPICKMDELL